MIRRECFLSADVLFWLEETEVNGGPDDKGARAWLVQV